MKFSKRSYLSLFVFLFSTFIFTATHAAPGVVRAKVANVREKPTTRSEVLLKLNRGDRLTVVKQVGKWLKVKVALDKSFTFDGYIFGSLVKWNKPRRVRRRVAPKPTPTPTPRKQNLDQFFSEPQKRTSRTTTRKPAPAPRKRSSSAMLAPRMDEDRASVFVGAGYILHNYSLSSGGATAGEVFAYNLSGISIDLGIQYWFLAVMDGKLLVGGNANYKHGIYKTSTNLLNSSGTQFGSQSSLSQSMDFQARLPVRYQLGGAIFKNVGLDVGGRFYKFLADDLSSDTGDVGLYVGQQWISILGGLNTRLGIPKFDALTIDVAFDILFLNFVSESPADATGTDASGSMGFLPSLDIAWALGDSGKLGLKYSLWLQKVSFSGGANRVGTALTDGSVENAVHNIGLTYTFGL